MELRNRMLALIFLACEGCNYPRQGGGSAQTPEKYRKTYGTFIRNLVVLRQAGITYSQFVTELKQDDPQWLQDLQTRVEQKKGAALTLNGVSIPPGLVDVAMLVMLTFDIVIPRSKPQTWLDLFQVPSILATRTGWARRASPGARALRPTARYALLRPLSAVHTVETRSRSSSARPQGCFQTQTTAGCRGEVGTPADCQTRRPSPPVVCASGRAIRHTRAASEG